ncbi:MAG: ribosome-associated translation inhibitor RaiA [Chlamydiales bacterium]
MSRKSKALEFADETYKIAVTGRNIQVTDAMKSYAIEKVSKIEKFSSRIIDVHIIMDIQKLEHRVDIELKVDHIKITGSASSTDMYASVDSAVDKITKRLRRYKSRIQDHQARGVKSIDMRVNVFAPHRDDDIKELNDAIEKETRDRLINRYHHPVVNEETAPLKLLTLDEAIMKMELSDDPFLVYQSEEDRKLKIIYRREDGNYGVIEPEIMST